MKTREELIEQYPYLIKALQTFGYETTEQFWSFVESYASQFKSNWIDVKERLPEKNQLDNEYLVVNSKTKMVTTLNFVQGKWHSDIIGGFVEQSLISHWQPLPQPTN